MTNLRYTIARTAQGVAFRLHLEGVGQTGAVVATRRGVLLSFPLMAAFRREAIEKIEALIAEALAVHERLHNGDRCDDYIDDETPREIVVRPAGL